MLYGHSKIRLQTHGQPARARSSAVASALAVLGSLAPLALAQGQPSRYERFQLFNDCRPTTVVVGILSYETVQAGVAEERLRADTESRLREARLYDVLATSSQLYVTVDVIDSSFHTTVQFSKRLYDVWTQEAYLAATWHRVIHGTLSGNSDIIVYAVAEAIDEFIRNYRRVNHSACESP